MPHFIVLLGWDLMNHEEGLSTSHFDVGTYVTAIIDQIAIVS